MYGFPVAKIDKSPEIVRAEGGGRELLDERIFLIHFSFRSFDSCPKLHLFATLVALVLSDAQKRP